MNPTPEPAPDKRTMIASPVASLLKSRKAIAALVGVLLNLLIAFLPPDVAPIVEDMRAELMAAITGIIMIWIGSIAYEDKGKPAPGTTTSTVEVSAQTTSTPPTTNGSSDLHG